MPQAPSPTFKIHTNPHNRPAASPSSRCAGAGRGTGNRRLLANGTGRAATGGGSEVAELEHGITVYPARGEGPLGACRLRQQPRDLPGHISPISGCGIFGGRPRANMVMKDSPSMSIKQVITCLIVAIMET